MVRMDSERLEAMHRVSLFQDLSESELHDIAPLIQERTYDKGEILYHVGEPCRRIIIIYRGRVKVVKSSSSGKEQILEVLEEGDTCACNSGSSEWICSASAETLTETVVWILDRAHYVKLLQSNSKLMNMLNHIFAQRLCRFSSLIESVALEGPKQRLVRFLLNYHDDHKAADQPLEIALTHEEISQRIGLVRETVTRQLQALKKANVIDILPHRIVILSPAALKRLMDE